MSALEQPSAEGSRHRPWGALVHLARLVDGVTTYTRQGRPEDLEIVQDFHARCSVASRARRYHSGKPQLAVREWAHLSDPTRGTTLISTPIGRPHQVIAMVNVMRTKEPGVAEIAVLVEDEWQGRGLGRAVLTHAAAVARAAGFHTLAAHIGADAAAVRRILADLGAVEEGSRFGASSEIRCRLTPVRSNAGASSATEAVPASACVQDAGVAHKVGTEQGLGTGRHADIVIRKDDGAQLAVYVDGPPEPRRTVVLVHGWNVSARNWNRHTRALLADDPHLRVVRFDQRGHGKSSLGASPVTIELLGRDLESVLCAVAPDDQVVLAGHSMGGMAIMALASSRPDLFADQIRGVLLTSTTDAGPRAPGETWFRRLMGSAGQVLFAACTRVPSTVESARRLVPQPDSRALAKAARTWIPLSETTLRTCITAMHATPAATLGAFYPALMLHNKSGQLAALRNVPVRILVGANDNVTPPTHSRRLAVAIHGSQLRVEPGCGHALPYLRPTVFLEQLRRLCESSLGPGLAATS